MCDYYYMIFEGLQKGVEEILCFGKKVDSGLLKILYC